MDITSIDFRSESSEKESRERVNLFIEAHKKEEKVRTLTLVSSQEEPEPISAGIILKSSKHAEYSKRTRASFTKAFPLLTKRAYQNLFRHSSAATRFLRTSPN